MKNLTIYLMLISGLSLPVHADISDTGDLDLQGQAIIHGTATVEGNAFSVGVSTLNVQGGKVGVGAANPAHKLHLSSGTFVIDGNATDSIVTSGKIGVKTANPARTLHVGGTEGMRIDPSALPGSPGAGDMVIDSADSNTLKWNNGTEWKTVGSGSGWADAGTVVSLETNTDQVGIGTANPCSTCTLHVLGGVGVSGALSVGGGILPTGEGSDSVIIGSSADAEDANDIAIGANADTSGGSSAKVAIGNGTEAGGGINVAVGSVAKSTGDSTIAIGYNAHASATWGTAVGQTAYAVATGASAYGPLSKAMHYNSVAVGRGAETKGDYGIAIGGGAEGGGLESTVIGSGAKGTKGGNSYADVVVIGNNAQASQAGAFFVGAPGSVISTVYFGCAAPTADPNYCDYTITASSGAGSNVDGSDVTIAGGKGTGTTGEGGSVILQTAPSAGGGNAWDQNTWVKRMVVSSSGTVNISAGSTAASTLSETTFMVNQTTGYGGFKLKGSLGACIMLRDSDDGGWTECTALNGILSCAIDTDGLCDGDVSGGTSTQ